MGSMVTIGLLGPVAVDTGQGMVEVPGVRARRLLAALAIDVGKVCSTDVLIDWVWSDDRPKSPQAALHTQISRLRRVVGEHVLTGGGYGYRLAPQTRTDLIDARELSAAGDAASLADAARLWRGAPGADLGDCELADELRSAADALHRTVEAARARCALDSGDAELARTIAVVLCDADPYDESAHVILMRALGRLDRSADALAVYEKLRRALSGELGIDPGESARRVHNELLSGTASSPSTASLRSGVNHGSNEPHDGVPHINNADPRNDEVATTSTPAASVDGAPAALRPVGIRAQPNELFGRDADVAAICATLANSRVVTVAGPGGMGKTRIAYAVANELLSQQHWVVVVELASIRSDDEVLGAIASAVGAGDTDLGPTSWARMPREDRRERVAAHVAGRRALLVLDNCEQIVDGCARAVADLISDTADLTVLTTSRSPLAIGGESIYHLGALTSSDDGPSPAVDLFIARARAVRPDAQLDRDGVARLCRALDGLPLAIELAAARVRTISVDDIRRLLNERLAAGRLTMLRSADRTAPQRHRTLQAVIDWSWELLDDNARTALSRLCRFVAGFSLDAARTVLGAAGMDFLDADDALESLVNQSLLRVSDVEGASRYRMLEMVREFGEERLRDVNDSANADDALRSWAVATADSIREDYERRGAAVAIRREIAEHDNLVWIVRRCLDAASIKSDDHVRHVVRHVFPAIAVIMMMRGMHIEVRALSAAVIDVIRRDDQFEDDAERQLSLVCLLISTGHVMMMRPDPRRIAGAITAIRRLHRPELATDDHVEFGAAVMIRRRGYSSLRVIVRAAVSARSDEVRGAALSVLSNIRENSGDISGALRDSMRAYELSAVIGDEWFSAMGAIELGGLLGQTGNYARAQEQYRAAISALEALGASEEVAQLHCYRALALLGCNEIDSAIAEVAHVAQVAIEANAALEGASQSEELPMLVCVTQAQIHWWRGEVEQAVECAHKCLQIGQSVGAAAEMNPSVLLISGAAVTLIALLGRRDEAAAHVRWIVGLADHNVVPGGEPDLPQIGSIGLTCVAALRYRSDPETLRRLLDLAHRASARRDHPVLDYVATNAHSWEEVAPQQDSELTMRRRAAGDEIIQILSSVRI